MCNAEFLKRREGAEWSGVTFGGSGEKGSCDRQPEAKTEKDGEGVRWGGERWTARESEFGAVSALRYYFHLPFPELSELLRSELMWAEICLSLWPRTGSG